LKRSTAVKRGWTFSRAWRALSRRAGGGRRFGVLILLGLLVAIGLAVAMCERAEEKVQFHLRTEIPSSGDAFALAIYQSLGTPLRPTRHRVGRCWVPIGDQ
jgi:hypothetical protein